MKMMLVGALVGIVIGASGSFSHHILFGPVGALTYGFVHVGGAQGLRRAHGPRNIPPKHTYQVK